MIESLAIFPFSVFKVLRKVVIMGITITDEERIESLNDFYSDRVSIKNAKYNKIKYHYELKSGNREPIPVFEIPCSACDSIIEKTVYYLNKVYVCDYCKIKLKNKQIAQQAIDFPDVRTPKEIKFDEAVCNLSKQVKNIDDYSKAIEIARERVERYGSVPEMMVAIELIKLKYSIIPQQKIGKYKVDFAIPKQKCIIEVDGKLYHQDYNKEMKREAHMRLILGMDWKIVHVPAELISKHITSLGEYIEKYKERL